VHQTFEPSDPMVVVHNEVPGAEISICLTQLFGSRCSAPTVGSPASGDLAFTDNTKPEHRSDKPMVDPVAKDRRFDSLELFSNRKTLACLPEQPCDSFSCTDTVHGDDYLHTPPLPVLQRCGN
jgi:hypothetical protein